MARRGLGKVQEQPADIIQPTAMPQMSNGLDLYLVKSIIRLVISFLTKGYDFEFARKAIKLELTR